MSLSAPDAVGVDAALRLVAGDAVSFAAARVHALVVPLVSTDVLDIDVTGADGGMARRVDLGLASASQVLVGRLLADEAAVHADTPHYRVAPTTTGNFAEHYTPGFTIRVDRLDRTPHAGFDARAFTLDGNYELDVGLDSAFIGAFIIQSNPRKIIGSDPGGSAGNDADDGLLGGDRGVRQTVAPLHIPGALSGAPASGTLVRLSEDWLEDGWLLDELRLLDEEEKKRRRGGE